MQEDSNTPQPHRKPGRHTNLPNNDTHPLHPGNPTQIRAKQHHIGREHKTKKKSRRTKNIDDKQKKVESQEQQTQKPKKDNTRK
jgi:hypothetical protein